LARPWAASVQVHASRILFWTFRLFDGYGSFKDLVSLGTPHSRFIFDCIKHGLIRFSRADCVRSAFRFQTAGTCVGSIWLIRNRQNLFVVSTFLHWLSPA
jgi:hypothetical protein